MSIPTRRDAALRGNQHFLLFVSLVFILAVVPLLEKSAMGMTLMRLGFSAVIFAGVFVISRQRYVFGTGLTVAAVVIIAMWTSFFVRHDNLFVYGCILEAAVLTLIAGFILVAVVRRHMATVQSVFGALSAYLLLGLAWAMLYFSLERLEGESLSFANRITVRSETTGEDLTAFSQLVYFSFVTMSTLGYGDILPETPLAQTLAWMQAVTGQFYLAVLVAWLVNEIPRPHRDE